MVTCRNKLNSFAIIGLGLVGGSIARDLRAKHPDAFIVAIDPDKQTINDAIQSGTINREIDYVDLPRSAQVIILAPPIDRVISCARRVFRSLKSLNSHAFDRYIILDTASVKKSIAKEFRELTAKSDRNVDFLATHPMAGTEYSGFSHAQKGLFRAKPWMVCLHSENSKEAISAMYEFVRELGARVVPVGADEHDKSAAVVSHAVIVLSNIIFDYIASRHPEALKLAGDGFTSTTRLASGNPELHKNIILNNSEYTEAILKDFLQFFDNKITNLSVCDAELLREYFTHNMNRRNEWIRRKK
jgi:prephenate dehydrogenase